MSADERTPGPWHAYPIEDGSWAVVQVHRPPQSATPIALSVANANLIAAAPDLLLVLKNVLDFYEMADALSPEIIEYAGAAIVRAQGDQT